MSDQKTERLEVRVTPEMLRLIDRARGDVPRSIWIRRALEAALRKEKKS